MEPQSGPVRPWYSSFAVCWPSCADRAEREPPWERQGSEVVRQQPDPERATSPSMIYRHLPHAGTWAGETAASLGRRKFAMLPRSRSYSPTGGDAKRRHQAVRRSRIGGPTDFRHLGSGSVDFPVDLFPDDRRRGGGRAEVLSPTSSASPVRRPRRASYRPLELSIYLPNNYLSPLAPHFGLSLSPVAPSGGGDCTILPPPRAHVAGSRDDAFVLTHQRSHSSTSFHLPRKQPSIASRSGSPVSMGSPGQAATLPRARPTTTGSQSPLPEVTFLVERIASAMIDLEMLQTRIDKVTERQSGYLGGLFGGSGPSSQAATSALEGLASVPRLPAPDAPSFAERINSRPKTGLPPPSTRSQFLLGPGEPLRPRTALARMSPLLEQSEPVTPLPFGHLEQSGVVGMPRDADEGPREWSETEADGEDMSEGESDEQAATSRGGDMVAIRARPRTILTTAPIGAGIVTVERGGGRGPPPPPLRKRRAFSSANWVMLEAGGMPQSSPAASRMAASGLDSAVAGSKARGPSARSSIDSLSSIATLLTETEDTDGEMSRRSGSVSDDGEKENVTMTFEDRADEHVQLEFDSLARGRGKEDADTLNSESTDGGDGLIKPGGGSVAVLHRNTFGRARGRNSVGVAY